jgi:hypothetical protein
MKWGEILADRLANRLRRIRFLAAPLIVGVFTCFYFVLDGDVGTSVYLAAIVLAFFGSSYLHAYGLLNNEDRLNTLKAIEEKQQAYAYVYGRVIGELKWLFIIAMVIGLLIVYS